MSKTPKILIASPQSDIKNYCFLDWYLNVKRISYPQARVDVFLADNSDTQDNCKMLESMGVKCKHIPKNGRGIIETMAECHQACVDYAIDNNYDYLLHLETDVFPSHDVLNNLMSLSKPIACGLYQIFDGAYREPMIRLIEDDNMGFMEAYAIANAQGEYLNGKPLKVFSAGLGCALIHKSVLGKIKFKYIEGQDQHPDTWFANDMRNIGIDIFCDTSTFCEHRNKSWGKYKINFE